MFRCNSEKAWWYLSRDLAEIISTEPDCIRVKLKFTPKGAGHHGDDFYLGTRENKCVVCGEFRNLTRHHIVPYHYRRELPLEAKSRNYHDVVLLCDACHRRYEEHARDLKVEIARRYNAPLTKSAEESVLIESKKHQVAKKAASAIELHRSMLPPDVLRRKLDEVAKYLGHDPTDEEIRELSLSQHLGTTIASRHAEKVVAQVDIQEFVEMWRFHFLSKMKPQHMPKHWNPKRLWSDTGPGRVAKVA
jgi:5-methylcytosine-specific restriction endonuclease McrA